MSHTAVALPVLADKMLQSAPHAYGASVAVGMNVNAVPLPALPKMLQYLVLVLLCWHVLGCAGL